MPAGGAQPGAGRKRGGKNKATIEREQRALEALKERAKTHTRTLAKDDLAELLTVVKASTQAFQLQAFNKGDGAPGKPGFDPAAWATFKEWAEFYANVCRWSAEFESPKYKAIAVVTNLTEAPAPMIDATPTGTEEDQDRVANQSYLRLVKG
jgi:hypothetical protein